jgi:hypothetical protein
LRVARQARAFLGFDAPVFSEHTLQGIRWRKLVSVDQRACLNQLLVIRHLGSHHLGLIGFAHVGKAAGFTWQVRRYLIAVPLKISEHLDIR